SCARRSRRDRDHGRREGHRGAEDHAHDCDASRNDKRHMTADRNTRNIALFGAEGQARIARTKVTIVGAGGLGAPAAQDLAYLGVLDYRLVDGDIVTTSRLNRMKGATPPDVGEKKVLVVERMIRAIQPTARVTPIP